jgi:putative transposase
VSAFIDCHRERFGVEPICQTLDVSASAYYERATGERSARSVEDERLTARIREVHEQNFECYGYPRVWQELQREGEDVGRDHVARLMRQEGIRGAKRRGKPWRTTIADPAAPKRPDLVNRVFTADRPDALWVGDLTYLQTWEGRMYLAFLIDVFSRMIVGWQLATHMRTGLVLDALRMALGLRRPGADVQLVAHTDQGSQGGFKWWSQHSIERSCDGQAEGMGVGADGTASDAITGSTGGGAQGASSAVLASDRSWGEECGRRRGGGRVRGRWRPVVQGGWRDAAVCDPGSAVGALSVVRRAGGDRAAARPEVWGAGDRGSARPFAVHDLPRAAS